MKRIGSLVFGKSSIGFINGIASIILNLPDEDIFAFENIMAELLYDSDTKQNHDTALKFLPDPLVKHSYHHIRTAEPAFMT